MIRRIDLDCSSEILWIELVAQNQSPLLFGVLYWSPSASNSVLEHGMFNALTSSLRYNIVQCGDFNVPNIDWNTACPTSSSQEN